MNDSQPEKLYDVPSTSTTTAAVDSSDSDKHRALIKKLKKARLEYQSIFDSVPAMIWYRDRNGQILKANQCAADSVGISVRELVGKNYYDLFPDGAERARQQDIEVMETGRPIRGQLRTFISRSGQTRWAMVDRIPLRDNDGQISGVMVFAVDITEQKKAEAELREANNKIELTNRRLKATAEQARLLAEKAARSNMAKSELLASSSHDLRTPMNSIVGFSEILLETSLDDEQREYVKTIHQAASGLLTLINDILEYSKMEAGKLNIEIVACSVRQILGETRAMMATGAKKKGLDFAVSIDERLPETIYTDPTRLRQCLINLIGNAIKFTDVGSVRVFACTDEVAGQPCIRFDVEDTGIGIPQDKQETIFKSFSQADASTARRYGGTGLGLAITRRLAGLLGGDIKLTSQVGKGSTFSLTLPLFVHQIDERGHSCLRVRTSKRYQEEKPAISGRILLYETEFPSQLTLTLMLRRYGLDVDLAVTPEQLHAATAGQPYHAILMDAGMGLPAAAKLLQTLRQTCPQTPVLLVADQDSCDIQNCSQAGFCECLFRPLSREQLFTTLSKYLPNACLEEHNDHQSNAAMDDAIASTESLLKQLPALSDGIQEVLVRSDIDLLGRFAELFSEIGQTTGQEALAQKAAAVFDCVQTRPDALNELTRLVDELCALCGQIVQGVTQSNPETD